MLFDEISTTEEASVVQREGTRNVKRKVSFYNLDVIISVDPSRNAEFFRQPTKTAV